MEITRENVFFRYQDLVEACRSEEIELRTTIFSTPKCEHVVQSYVQRQNNAGAWCFYKQCTTCYRYWQTSRAVVEAQGINPIKLPELIEVDIQSGWEEKRAIFNQELSIIRDRYVEVAWNRYMEECRSEQASYDEYIRSPKWKQIRERVLRRDNYMCQGCLINRAAQVHHLTYDHLGDELLFELVSVCISCHEKIHGRNI